MKNPDFPQPYWSAPRNQGRLWRRELRGTGPGAATKAAASGTLLGEFQCHAAILPAHLVLHLEAGEVSHASMGWWRCYGDFLWWLVPFILINDVLSRKIVCVDVWLIDLAVGYKLACLICDYIPSMRIHARPLDLLVIHPEMSGTNTCFKDRKAIF